MSPTPALAQRKALRKHVTRRLHPRQQSTRMLLQRDLQVELGTWERAV